MKGFRLVHEDEECQVFEQEELEVGEGDILLAEPVEETRPSVRLAYESVNAFLGQYLLQIRRGEPIVVAAPRGLERGDVIDVEIAIDARLRFTLHAQVLSRWPLSSSELAEVQFVAGRMTDRIIAPLAEQALGGRHVARMFR